MVIIWLTFDSGDLKSATEGLSVARVVLRMLATPAPPLPLPLPAAGGGMLRSLPLFITSAMIGSHLLLSLYRVTKDNIIDIANEYKLKNRDVFIFFHFGSFSLPYLLVIICY